MGRVRRASLSDILAGARSFLVTQTGLDDSRVVITCLSPDDTPRLAAAQDVLLRLLNEEPEVGVIEGAGRYDNRRKRKLEVTQRTRLSLDVYGQDLYRLTDTTLGHLALEDTVCDALELYFPTSGDNALSLPFRVGGLSSPQRLRADPDWLFSSFTVEIEYSRALDTTRV